MPKKGLFNWDDLTVRFGGELSVPKNIFTAKAIKVPDFKYRVRERESLGNGWYGNMETNEYTEDNLYIIIKDDICIGTMRAMAGERSKRDLTPLSKWTSKEVYNFLDKNNIKWKN